MKTIDKTELFEHFAGFLKSRGVELKEGSYTHRIQQGCSLLADSVNLTQEAFEKARVETERGLDQLRQKIHEKTAPKTPKAAPSPDTATPPPAAKPAARKPRSAARTKTAPRKRTAKG